MTPLHQIAPYRSRAFDSELESRYPARDYLSVENAAHNTPSCFSAARPWRQHPSDPPPRRAAEKQEMIGDARSTYR
jgi:hypothetical protein